MQTIQQLREKIEQADAVIIEAIARREELSKQIGLLKSAQGQEVVDLTREKELFALYEALSERYHLQLSFVKQVFKLIIAHSRKVQHVR